MYSFFYYFIKIKKLTLRKEHTVKSHLKIMLLILQLVPNHLYGFASEQWMQPMIVYIVFVTSAIAVVKSPIQVELEEVQIQDLTQTIMDVITLHLVRLMTISTLHLVIRRQSLRNMICCRRNAHLVQGHFSKGLQSDQFS